MTERSRTELRGRPPARKVTTLRAKSPTASARPYRVASDPEVGPDAGCIVCSQPRAIVARLHGDPFCSSACCRIWYRV